MYNDIVSFLPDVANGLIVLLVGYVIARIVSWLVRLVLARVGLDGLSERRGIAGGLRGLGIGLSPSRLIAQTVFGLLFPGEAPQRGPAEEGAFLGLEGETIRSFTFSDSDDVIRAGYGFDANGALLTAIVIGEPDYMETDEAFEVLNSVTER